MLAVALVTAAACTGGEGAQPDGPPGPRPPEPPLRLVDYDAMAQPDGVTPWIQSLLDLPACRDDGGLRAWAGERLPSLPAEPAVPVPLGTVVRETPILLRPPPVACSVALRKADALAWELQDSAGVAVARGATSSSALAADPWGGVEGDIFQDVIASGQHLNGLTTSTRIGGRLALDPRDERLFVTDFPYHGPPRDPRWPWAGRWIAGWFGVSEMRPPDYRLAVPVPRLVPEGFVRCAGPVEASFDPMQGRVTTLCHPDGSVITVRVGAPTSPEGTLRSLPDFEADRTTTVAHIGDRRLLTAGSPVGRIVLDVPARIDEDGLRRMAATVPALDDRTWRPPGLAVDLRERFSVDWVRDALVAAGAREVLADEADRTVDGGLGLVCAGGGPCVHPPPRPIEVNLTLPTGERIEGFVMVDKDPYTPWPPHGLARIRTVSGVDVRISEQPWANPVELRCGGVHVSLRTLGIGRGVEPGPADPIADLAERLVPALGC